MNEKHVTFLIKQVRQYLDQLEAEVRNHPEDYLPRSDWHEQIKLYEEWDDDDGWTD